MDERLWGMGGVEELGKIVEGRVAGGVTVSRGKLRLREWRREALGTEFGKRRGNRVAQKRGLIGKMGKLQGG